ncbi:kinase-like domain-containing protein [Cyathus striatus]|nr:kinase-like domain-containing protein [Cyathus striatus]
MSAPNSEHVKGITTAFSHGTRQRLQDVSVLNAGGNITYFNFGDTTRSDNSSLPGTSEEPDSRISLAYRTLSYMLSLFRISQEVQQEFPLHNPGGTAPPSADMISESAAPKFISEDNNITADTVVVISNEEPEFIPTEASKRAPRGYDVYIEKMFPLNHGYPLWVPYPDHNLPIEYQRKGISIGDVGCITHDGAFDFLFNIWTPAQSPIHGYGVPDGFESMPTPTSGMIEPRLSFFQRDMLTSFANVNREIDSNTLDVTYSFSDEDKGSLLVMPDGGSQHEYVEVEQLKDFIARNAECWYRYAVVERRRTLGQHSLYLITGCLKSRSWGIVTWDTKVSNRQSTLVIGRSPDPAGPAFEWKKVVNASSFRTGPSPGLTTNAESQLPDEANQCLFIRGYRISLSEQALNFITYGPKDGALSNDDKNWDTDSKKRDKSGRKEGHPKSNEGGQSKYVSSSKFHHKNEVNLTDLSERQNPLHPLNAINDILLAQVSGSRVAITHDKEWWAAVRGCKNEVANNHNYNIQNFEESLNTQYVYAMTKILDDQISDIKEISSATGDYTGIYSAKWYDPKRGFAEVTIKFPPRQSGMKDVTIRRIRLLLHNWTTLHHPNILKLVGLYTKGPMSPFGLVALYRPEGDAAMFLEKNPNCDRMCIILDIAEALHYLHCKNIVNGTVNPSNVMINKESTVVIPELEDDFFDFFANDNTARYCAPEIDDSQSFTKAGDIYSFGMFMLYILTSKIPFYYTVDKLVAIVTVKLGIKPERKKYMSDHITDHLWRIMEKCWEKDPGDRGTMQEIVELLKA